MATYDLRRQIAVVITFAAIILLRLFNYGVVEAISHPKLGRRALSAAEDTRTFAELPPGGHPPPCCT